MGTSASKPVPSTLVAATMGCVCAAAIVVAAVAYKKIAFGGDVIISEEAHEEYENWRGRPEFYFFRASGPFGHGGLVFRGTDPNTGLPLKALMLHLVIVGGKWLVCVNLKQWAPQKVCMLLFFGTLRSKLRIHSPSLARFQGQGRAGG